jgi:hypothetical protein
MGQFAQTNRFCLGLHLDDLLDNRRDGRMFRNIELLTYPGPEPAAPFLRAILVFQTTRA